MQQLIFTPTVINFLRLLFVDSLCKWKPTHLSSLLPNCWYSCLWINNSTGITKFFYLCCYATPCLFLFYTSLLSLASRLFCMSPESYTVLKHKAYSVHFSCQSTSFIILPKGTILSNTNMKGASPTYFGTRVPSSRGTKCQV
jgi:hypothetical protein